MARRIHGTMISVRSSNYTRSSIMTPRPLVLESQMGPMHHPVIIDGYGAFDGMIIC